METLTPDHSSPALATLLSVTSRSMLYNDGLFLFCFGLRLAKGVPSTRAVTGGAEMEHCLDCVASGEPTGEDGGPGVSGRECTMCHYPTVP